MKKFQIAYPVDVFLVSQGFGDNKGFYSDPKYGGIIGHNGIDLFEGHGNPVYASHNGFANFEIDISGGHGVVITTNEKFIYKVTETTPDGQAYFKTIYWHLCDGIKEPKFKSPLQGTNGFQVKEGDLIGYADNTGASTGDHLHFGMKPMYRGGDGQLYNVEQKNGYLGAIDPFPYFDGSTPKLINGFRSAIISLTAMVALLKAKVAAKLSK